jgi:hypothetical protein
MACEGAEMAVDGVVTGGHGEQLKTARDCRAVGSVRRKEGGGGAAAVTVLSYFCGGGRGCKKWSQSTHGGERRETRSVQAIEIREARKRTPKKAESMENVEHTYTHTSIIVANSLFSLFFPESS